MNVDCELERESCTDVVARDLRFKKTQILAGILLRPAASPNLKSIWRFYGKQLSARRFPE
jgi:hypothetical protein